MQGYLEHSRGSGVGGRRGRGDPGGLPPSQATVLRMNGWMSPDTNKSTTTTNPNTGDTTFIKFTTSTPQIITSPTTTTHTSNDATNTSTNAACVLCASSWGVTGRRRLTARDMTRD
ncbi:unnamed protein product [Arctogadus glacialis]